MPRTMPTAPGPSSSKRSQTDGGYVMVRNPDWWGYERYPDNIDRIVSLPVATPNRASRRC